MKNETIAPRKVGDIQTFLEIQRFLINGKTWLRTSARESYTHGDELSERVAQSKAFATYRNMVKTDQSGILKAEKIRLVRVTSEILTPELDPNSL